MWSFKIFLLLDEIIELDGGICLLLKVLVEAGWAVLSGFEWGADDRGTGDLFIALLASALAAARSFSF